MAGTDLIDLDRLTLYDSLIKDYIDAFIVGPNENLCPQDAASWEQGGISATGGNLSRTHTIRLKNDERFEVVGGMPYLIDIQDGYTVNIKPYNSAGTFYADPNLAATYIQNYPFIWIPDRDGYLRMTCTIDGSTAFTPSGIEDALPVVRKATMAEIADVLYHVEIHSGYATGASGASIQAAAGEMF